MAVFWKLGSPVAKGAGTWFSAFRVRGTELGRLDGVAGTGCSSAISIFLSWTKEPRRRDAGIVAIKGL